MEECKPTSTPMNQKEKFCKKDGAEKADEGLFRSMIGCLMYLTSTRPDIMYVVSLLSSQVKIFILHGYSDNDWTGCVDDMQTEAEYVDAIATINQVLWLRKLQTNLDMKQEMSTQVFLDNQTAISIANDPIFHGKTKHFKIKLYFLDRCRRKEMHS
ncbi:hypothetical protein CK203_039179 [Vitis vinifera]|uniref:Copia protein n=1 Tax=Vitis vinifera TaxID=29760 RepID=A0A438H775_VITVI|nr:hypothetical protein CK203_039179 [Vitis vinifera]